MEQIFFIISKEAIIAITPDSNDVLEMRAVVAVDKILIHQKIDQDLTMFHQSPIDMYVTVNIDTTPIRDNSRINRTYYRGTITDVVLETILLPKITTSPTVFGINRAFIIDKVNNHIRIWTFPAYAKENNIVNLIGDYMIVPVDVYEKKIKKEIEDIDLEELTWKM